VQIRRVDLGTTLQQLADFLKTEFALPFKPVLSYLDAQQKKISLFDDDGPSSSSSLSLCVNSLNVDVLRLGDLSRGVQQQGRARHHGPLFDTEHHQSIELLLGQQDDNQSRPRYFFLS